MNFEKMLGSMIGSFLTGSSSKKTDKKNDSTSGIMNQLKRGLASPQGLMAAAGVAFGAFEAYQRSQQGVQATGQTPPPPVPGASTAPPPPVPGATVAPPPVPGASTAPPPVPEAQSGGADDNQTVRLIQAMISAAWADGHMDETERERIVGKVKEGGITPDEEEWLISQMSKPLSIQDLTSGITDVPMKNMLFGFSYAAIDEDTPEETKYLEDLATALGLSDGEVASLKNSF